MPEQLTTDEITARCHQLVYQVAYAFYDTPYIILLKLLVHIGVVAEKRLGEICGLNTNDIRKYLGTLHVHRLIKRHVNKEKHQINEAQMRNTKFQKQTVDGQPNMRIRDVMYWYIDYREFADVVKYRIAMMRKSIDEKVKQEVGRHGYICPNCHRTYNPLDLSHLFNPSNNSFTCENCQSELVEYDPHAESSNQDKMQAFNIATQPIRDSLKNLEGLTLPSENIVAWLAKNVISVVDLEKGQGGEDVKFKVVLGGEEKDQLEMQRLAEQQRVQNALPIWHTHSTVTGTATTLGLADQARQDGSLRNGVLKKETAEDDDEDLEAHYANLAEDDDGLEEMEAAADQSDIPTITKPTAPAPTVIQVKDDDRPMLFVNGIAKPFDEITDEDQELMSAEEYQAYYDAALA